MEIRQITEDDAEAFLTMQRQLDLETDFMLMAPGERQTTVAQQRDIIHKILSDGRSMIWVVADGQRLVGALTFQAMAPLKIRHTGYIVVGILAAHRGRGLGSALFRTMEAWAHSHEFHRLELTVICENRAALNLYLKQGFMVEGLRHDSILQPNGHWVHEYTMVKLL
ncbi:GNAT family N-acetyltransferase [Sulfobacillus thermosulfidooxidans]|uniref:GNAT family N-acetyltransferase n=1 Tax=Sulfobacillus thermosulfidooxidans TaxID=28034 RepID=UPI0006B670A2|nr:GNAT family N-acetyltransferase [Sulfobacillus thermosulfidooxidans]